MMTATPAGASPALSSDLSVMTYNVHGLPWPVAENRHVALQAIGQRLWQMRQAGRQPHVVLLQEAFTEDAKRIGQIGGYRYVGYGPAASAAGETPLWEAGFSALMTAMKSGTPWKAVDSGLAILSDYPILSMRMGAFSGDACAGYDCLANKGALLASIALPGAPRPVMLATVHLNARFASGVPANVSDRAYALQLGLVDRFLNANRDPSLPLILGGDFNNAGRIRSALLLRHATAMWRADGMSSIGEVLSRLPVKAVPNRALPPACSRNKDWQFQSSGASAHIMPVRLSLPFGLERDGSALSDHFGYAESYRVDWQAKGAGKLAARGKAS